MDRLLDLVAQAPCVSLTLARKPRRSAALFAIVRPQLRRFSGAELLRRDLQAVLLCAGVLVAGCDESQTARAVAAKDSQVGVMKPASGEPEGARVGAAPEGAASPGAAPEGAPAPNARSSYEDQAFKLELGGPTEVKVGESVELSLVLTARGGFKVNAEYPIKFKVQATEGIAPERQVVDKEAGEVDEHRAELPVRVRATKKGALDVAGRLSFSVCTDDRCLIERRDLKATLNAS
jgi:hypothetical protein